ncbi:MAG: PKD domain-containing protein [Bacteroidales bacterium]|nr:PKD domain-containing protein [Bacteroidales bacterium]
MICVILFLISFYVNAQLKSYELENRGYISRVYAVKNGYIITLSLQNDIYYLKNNKLIKLISAPGCARYLSVNYDKSFIGFKLIDSVGLQQPVILNIETGKIKKLYSAVTQVGQPVFDMYGNVYFTIGKNLYKYANDSLIFIYNIGEYVNYIAVSKSGKYIAYSIDEKGLFILNTTNSSVSKIDGLSFFYPKFSPSERYVAFATNPDVLIVYDLFTENIVGTYCLTGFSWHNIYDKIIGLQTKIENFDIVNSDIIEVNITTGTIDTLIKTPNIIESIPYYFNDYIIYADKENYLIYKYLVNNKEKYIVYKANKIAQSYVFPKNNKADILVPGTVPYVHQVYDTPSWHEGWGSCAPTTAIMAIAYYNKLPQWPTTVNHGYSWDPHVSLYGSYVADKYRYNEWYYQESANAYGTTAYGGYGYMWTGSYSPSTRMKNYIQNHYLTSNQYWTTSCTFNATVNEINNGYVHPICSYLTSSGHLTLAIGYVSGQYTLIFNDPYGNKNTPGYPSYDGAGAKYDWPGYNYGYQNLDADGSHGYVAWTVTARGSQPTYNDTLIDDLFFNHGFFMNNFANGSHMRFFRDFNVGYNNHCWYTLGVASGGDVCYVKWTPTINQAGHYSVKAFIPSKGCNTQSAKYKIYHANGVDSVIINQHINRNQWVNLGTYYFNAGTSGYVYLGDMTGTDGDSIAFDAVCFSRVQVDNTPPTTTINYQGNWQTGSFNCNFIDTDNYGIEKAFYQVLDFDGQYWGANAQRGFFGDNFDIMQPHWNVYSGTWSVANGELIQTDEQLNNTNIYAFLNQNLSNRYLYHFIAKYESTSSTPRFGFHFFSDSANCTNRNNSYFVWFRIATNTIEFYKVVNNSFSSPVYTISNVTLHQNQWYDFKITYDRITGEIAVWINNSFKGSWIDSSPFSSNGKYISFRTGNSKLYVTELKVYRSRYPSVTINVSPTGDIRYQNPNPQTPSGRIKSIVVDIYKNLSSIAHTNVNVDWTPPSFVTIYDNSYPDCDTIFSVTNVNAIFTSSTDSNSGVLNYKVSIGTQPCVDNIFQWTVVNDTTYLMQNLNLQLNTPYYINVKAINNAMLESTCSNSDGFIVFNNVYANFYAIDTILYLPNAYAIFVNTSQNATSYFWDFGDGQFSTEFSPYHLYSDTGLYTVKLYAYNNGLSDSLVRQNYIHVKLFNLLNDISNDLITVLLDGNKLIIVNGANSKMEYSIMDISGRIILKDYIFNRINEINISQLSSGVYFIKINNFVKKFLINNTLNYYFYKKF